LLVALLAASFAKFCEWAAASPVVAIGGEALREELQRQKNKPTREGTG
jgi:hypothetical protein